jgi:hypothetical protein
MGYLKKQVEESLELTAASASVNSQPHDGEPYDKAILYVDVTAVTGTTPALIVGLETSPDGGTTWYSLGNGASISSVTKQRQVYENIGKLVRVAATISGTTPAFTGTIDIELAKEGIR